MPEMIIREAIAHGLREALDRDEDVFMLGEDIGAYDGAYAVTRGFLERYGPERIRDTPISESGFVGAAIGASLVGMRPVVEIMTINFSLLAMDQIINHAAKLTLYVQRPAQGADADKDGHRRRSAARRDALAELRGMVRICSGTQGRRAVNTL